MLEIRLHGRGGQGVVTMAELLAEAAYYSGWVAQAFPVFGVERRGAPIMSFVRLDKKPIRLRSQVYQPDFLLILDSSLLNNVQVLAGAKSNALVIVNSAEPIELKSLQVITISALTIARQVLHNSFVNTVMLGGFAAASSLISLAAIDQVLTKHFSPEVAKKNYLAAQQAFKMIAGQAGQ